MVSGADISTISPKSIGSSREGALGVIMLLVADSTTGSGKRSSNENQIKTVNVLLANYPPPAEGRILSLSIPLKIKIVHTEVGGVIRRSAGMTPGSYDPPQDPKQDSVKRGHFSRARAGTSSPPCSTRAESNQPRGLQLPWDMMHILVRETWIPDNCCPSWSAARLTVAPKGSLVMYLARNHPSQRFLSNSVAERVRWEVKRVGVGGSEAESHPEC
ncbi:hypothetical protein EDC04DRAFT_2604036 [Pisolithus marmoratus]|nr:hypothetical protein EDC04DRAFT_2604036 [Pisolithus marmoratus]